jgi:dihydrodipicolinate reductase
MSVAEKNRTVKIGVVGLGGRGRGLIGTLAQMDDVVISAVCDIVDECIDEAIGRIREYKDYPVKRFNNYHDLLAEKDIEGVVIATSWNEHIEIAIASMEAGKYAAFEVGGANSIEECWDLVKTYEKTKVPCMMLENCCYGQYELAILNMIRHGLFGEIIHCAGGYHHDLRTLANALARNKQRSFHHLHRNAELYPTHEIGPISKYLNINRGNRFLTLTSTASKSRGLGIRAEEVFGKDNPYTQNYALGDIVTTVIKCAGGETITLTHDTSLPRPYSRGNAVHGTKGIWMEINKSVYFEDLSPNPHEWEPIENYLDKYNHPIWKEFLEDGVTGGHGGMDYLVLRAFIESIQNETITPIDVYESASWMAITCLSEQSISMGSMPVAFPDFTNGKWLTQRPVLEGKYSLDK